MRAHSAILWVLYALSFLAFFPSQAWPLPADLRITISDRFNVDEGPVGGYRLMASGSYAGATSQQLFAPDGTPHPAGRMPYFVFNTFDELIAFAEGEWELKVIPDSSPDKTESYHFTISPFGLDVVTVERPRILEPVGQYFNKPFLIVWDPPTSNWGMGGGGMGFDNELVQPGVMSVELLPLAGIPDGQVGFSTSAGQGLMSYISPPIPSVASPIYDLQVALAYSRVAEKTFYYNYVPEPTGFILLGLAAMPLLGSRRNIRGM
jgi:hypothetical protein